MARSTLHAYLVAVILVATVPLATLSFILLTRARDSAQAQFDDSLQATARSDMLLVDHEIGSITTTLGLLARSPEMHEMRPEALHAWLQQLAQAMPGWHSLYVAAPDGEMLLSTLVPYGTPLAPMADSPDHAQALRTRGPVVRGLQREPVRGEWLTGVQVPVSVDGHIKYFLGAWTAPARWQSLLQTAGVPREGSAVTLFDARQRIVARSAEPAPPLGPVTQGTPLRLGSAAGGLQHSTSPEGEDRYMAWQRMGPHGWSVAVEIPGEPVEQARSHGLLLAAAGALLSLATGTLLAWLVGRCVTMPLRQLALHGASGLRNPVPVQEIAQLRDALKKLEEDHQQAAQGLRESRRMVELAQQAGKVGFFDYHFDDHLVHGTASLAQLLGLPAEAFELPWSQWLMCLDPRDLETVQAAIATGRRQGLAEVRFEFRSRERGEDAPRWFASRCALVPGECEQGRLIGVVLDITEQKSAEHGRAEFLAELQKGRRLAEEANRAKDEFLAMLGHELRNPLGAISAAAEVLSRAPTPELANRARTIVQNQTRHLGHLMNDLLDVTRVMAGKISLTHRPHDLQHCVSEVVDTLEMSSTLPQYTLQLELQPAWVRVDSTRTEQIVSNLLTNALKYTPQGGTIAIKTWREGPMGVLQVKDNGMGMSAALVSTAFELFVQGERGLDRRQGGLGLGLTLVRRLAELQGGFASAESAGPGQGSCFTVYLPGAEIDRGSAPLPAARAEAGRRHIVIVEDNAEAREALQSMLELDGYEVETAEEGVSGLALILRTRPNAALIDIGLPGLDGLEIAARLRQAGLTSRLVAVSGYGQQVDVARALAAGFDSHMIKPIDPLILALRLNAAPEPDAV